VQLPIIASSYSQAIVAILVLAAVVGLCLQLRRFVALSLLRQSSLVDQVNRLLPQTQCGRCGFEGCRPYARAIIEGESINRCPPGGTATIIQLSRLLNELPQSLNPAVGKHQPPSVAVIREAECIGCTKCIQACPVDAILGAGKVMHTVLEQECTGCDLCVEPCPVDCIDMVELTPTQQPIWHLPNRLISPQNSLESAS
jgi:electron transport complex protein RnfB